MSPKKTNEIATTYGPIVLSGLALLFVAVAFFLGRIDWTTAIAVVGTILGANGLYGATRWQAGAGIAGQFAEHLRQHDAPANPNPVRVPTAIVLPKQEDMPPRG